MCYPLKRGVVRVFILLVISLLAAWVMLGRLHAQAGSDSQNDIEENG